METKDYQCSIEVTIDAIGGKWKCIILYYLSKNGAMRFGEILRTAKGASTKMIAQQLRQLEAHGLLEKEIFPEIPPRVEYKLTPYGNSVVPLLYMMSEWGGKHWCFLDHTDIEAEVLR